MQKPLQLVGDLFEVLNSSDKLKHIGHNTERTFRKLCKMVDVRPATTQDAEAIHQIYSTITNTSQSSVEQWRERLASAILLVAESGSGIDHEGVYMLKELTDLND